ncbi:MAG TPA: two-component regulator propeller domain-containing protein [Bacteroidia bacterium]|nr:two-component regulator propeller domain-containing protein [Bacteroidia bacterium]HRG51954.1 two-component regulator propeller domain-containing protein [Bacteroidia bacterium]
MRICFYLFLLFSATLLAQTKEVSFNHYTVNDGISQSSASCILQDSEGYIWFGTQNGLNKFNGDRKKNVWIASAKGLSRFNLSEKKFYNYFHSENDTASIPDNYINTLYEDKEGEIWVGTLNGVCRYDQANDTFIRFGNKLRNSSILSILQDSNGNFWFGTFSEGLHFIVFDEKKTKLIDFKNYSNNIKDGRSLANDLVSSLYEDRSHILWAGSFSGMNTLDLKPKKFQLYKKTESEHSTNLLDNSIASVYKDKNDMLWIGNWGKGLNILNRKTGHVTHYSPTLEGKHKIINGYVHVIFKDPDDNMWIATRNGIQVFNAADSSFTALNNFLKTSNLPEFKNTRIRKLYKDSNKNIWIGSNKGLYKINYTTKKIEEYLTNGSANSISDNLIYDILETKDGKFWVGTVNGLNLLDPATNKFIRYFNDPHNPQSISSSMIINLLQDHEGDLWIGTNCGLNLLKKESTRLSIR